jgi:DNA-binding NtrC family response regulator
MVRPTREARNHHTGRPRTTERNSDGLGAVCASVQYKSASGAGRTLVASILVIDDDSQVGTLLRIILEGAGHNVRCASNGAEGIRAHRRQQADLILCDIFMPEKDGLETIREICAEFPRVKVIAMSGGSRMRGPTDFLPIAKRLGAAVVLKKPFDTSRLEEIVDEVLQRQQLVTPAPQS